LPRSRKPPRARPKVRPYLSAAAADAVAADATAADATAADATAADATAAAATAANVDNDKSIW
jgi:hypothetical protein